MPTSRLVTGYIFRANNNPWVGGQVLFSLFPGTYTPGGIQYPKSTIAATTNESGYFETILFCNEEGEEPSYYTCVEPSGEISRWVLPVGTAPIDLSILKQAGLTRGDPQYQTLLSYVDARIQASSVSVIADNFVAGSTISALRVVKYDTTTEKIFLASSSNITDIFKVVGITSQSGVLNDNVQVVTSGYFSDNSWNWQLDKPIFFNNSGILTQTHGSAFYQVVGFPVKSNKILVSIEQPIVL